MRLLFDKTLKSRDGSLSKDTLLTNGFRGKVKTLEKRPGTVQAFDFDDAPFKGAVRGANGEDWYVMFGDKIYQSPTFSAGGSPSWGAEFGTLSWSSVQGVHVITDGVLIATYDGVSSFPIIKMLADETFQSAGTAVNPSFYDFSLPASLDAYTREILSSSIFGTFVDADLPNVTYLMVSNDNAVNWSFVNGGTVPGLGVLGTDSVYGTLRFAIFVGGGYLWLSARDSIANSGSALYRSADGGSTWNKIYTLESSGTWLARGGIYLANGDVVVVLSPTATSTTMKTYKNGALVSTVTGTHSSFNSSSNPVSQPVELDGVMYRFGNTGRAMASEDQGATWTDIITSSLSTTAVATVSFNGSIYQIVDAVNKKVRKFTPGAPGGTIPEQTYNFGSTPGQLQMVAVR